MSITIAEFVKNNYLRMSGADKLGRDEKIRQLSGFEEIVKTTVIDKITFLNKLLDIEIFFFSRKNNDAKTDQCILTDFTNSNKRKNDQIIQEFEKWTGNNHLFGEAIDKTKDYTDRRFDRKPRIKTNMENGNKYLDKAKFLTKFSCFDGYMQYVDTRWDEPCEGVNYEEFKATLQAEVEKQNRQSVRSSFYNNYLTEEMLVKTIGCGGYEKQPICLYDFSVKTMSHDCLAFSTRHFNKDGMTKYIDKSYIEDVKNT